MINKLIFFLSFVLIIFYILSGLPYKETPSNYSLFLSIFRILYFLDKFEPKLTFFDLKHPKTTYKHLFYRKICISNDVIQIIFQYTKAPDSSQKFVPFKINKKIFYNFSNRILQFWFCHLLE